MFIIDLYNDAVLGIGDIFALAGGLTGYEGQPGNQGGSNGTPNGLKGYEGQPGNQGGK